MLLSEATPTSTSATAPIPQLQLQPTMSNASNGTTTGSGPATTTMYHHLHLQPQSEAIKFPRLMSPATSPCGSSTIHQHQIHTTSMQLQSHNGSNSSSSNNLSKMSPATSPTMSRLPALQYAISTHRRGDLRLPALVSPVATSASSASPTSMIRPAERDGSTHATFANSLQLSMQECETPHYPSAALCCPPEASPIEKKQQVVSVVTNLTRCCSSTSASSSCSSRTCDSPNPPSDDDGSGNHTMGTNNPSASNNNRKKGTRRGTLNAEAKNVLKAWMFSPEHIEHPYPSEEEKEELASEAGIEVKQLSNWFTNARKRLWQPVLRQSGVEVKNFLSTGRGGPRGNNKLKLPAHLHHLMASQRLLETCSSPGGSACSDSSPPMSPCPEDGNSNGTGETSSASGTGPSFTSPQKRKWSETQLHNAKQQVREVKKSKSSYQRKRHSMKEHALVNSLQAKNGMVGSTSTSPVTSTTSPSGVDFDPASARVSMLSKISQELRMALAEKKTMPHLQELEILAATSLIGLHHQQSVY